MATLDRRSVARRWRTLAAGLFVIAVSGASAGNGGDSAAQFLRQEFERARTGPVSGPILPARPGQRAAGPGFRRAPRLPAVAEHRPPRVAAAPAPTMFVAVYGDRLGQALADGLGEAQGPTLGVDKLTEDGGGLARADFTEWLQSVRDRLRKPKRLDGAVMMIGANDRVPLGDDGGVDFGTPRWLELYGSRVDAVAAAFRDAAVPLIWVSLPAVRDDAASADFVRLNAVVRDRAGRDGVTYVDSWDAFIDEGGRYSPTGPDVDGTVVKLRRADGVGFTRAGARKLASFVEGDLNRLHAPAPAPEVARITIDKARDFDSALEIDVGAQIRREAGLAPATAPAEGREGARPGPAPERPVAGAVLPLTGPPSSPGAQLAGAADPASGLDRALQASLIKPAPPSDPPPAPKPDRADDFSWPKP